MAYRPYAPIGRARLILLGLFVVGVVVITYVQLAYALPKRRCEETRRVFDYKTRSCATVVFIPDLTGRPAPAGVKRPANAVRVPQVQQAPVEPAE